ncbi:MAG TPA: right-handed parallel beta-helix repeat-containing protein, partial [Candidatus Binatia bacterium]|nr:right-handed parallel beta-helix repeat-containing protein [Candidatus Binatia bacterium]
MRTLVPTALLLALALPAHGADYWVANGGSNANDGLGPGSAWATLQHAADVVAAGDTVHVVDGSYQGFDLRSSGASGSPITFRAEGTAARITADNGVTPDGVNVENAAHVVLDGFVVDEATRAGIRVAVSSFVTVRRCRTGRNGRWGIFSGFADDLVIEDNETYESQLEHGIYVSNSGDRPVIRRNHVHDNHANGIHMNGDESQGGDGLITGALVERNVIHGNGVGGGSGINMDGVTDSVVQNNLLYDNHASGISLYRIDGATGSTGNRVVNNTIVNAADGRWCVNVNNGSTGNTVANNVLYDFHSFRGAIAIDASSRPGFVADHNAVIDRFSSDGGDTVIGLAAWQALGYDLHSFVATPAALFLVPGSDFHLRADAPAIDAGTSAGAPAEDLDGGPRPVGAGVDVGAYELQLLECGDGGADPGEQCGEPELACTDVCTTCLQCICAADTPVCGDGRVCGAEQCEDDADCGGGAVCAGCRCENPSACASGIPIERPRLRLRANPGSLRLRGDAVIPPPWTAIDPAVNGLRIVIDGASGPGGVDVVVPGGAGWKTSGDGARWTFTDATGAHAGIRQIVVRDRS